MTNECTVCEEKTYQCSECGGSGWDFEPYWIGWFFCLVPTTCKQCKGTGTMTITICCDCNPLCF